MLEFATPAPFPRASGLLPIVAGVLSLLLAVGCSAKSQSQHLERVPLNERACWDAPTCFEVLERSSDGAAQQYAEQQLAAFGAAAIPRLSWLLGHGDSISKYLASGALGRIAATKPGEVLGAAGGALRERCADSGWSACWALAQAKDHSVYPLLAEHLRNGLDAAGLFDGRAVPAVVAEWFIVEIEDRAASGPVHSGVVDVLQMAEGTLSDASLERVRRILSAELPPDLSSVPSGYPCRISPADCWSRVDYIPGADTCSESVAECWPRVDYLVTAVGAWGPRGFPARQEVRAVWESTPEPHKYVARSALARIGDRAIIPSLLRELSPLDRRALQDLELLGKVARPELPQLIALFQSAPGNERAALFETIMAIGGPLAAGVGIEALHNPADDDASALHGLLEASKEKSTALGSIREERARIEYLATRSSYRRVRELARELLGALGFEAPAPREPLPCPPVIVSAQLVPRARLASGTVIFEPLGRLPEDNGGCAKGMPNIRVGDECLSGHSLGEFGYKITVDDARSERSRGTVRGVGLNPLHFLRYGEHLLIIEALEHMIGRGNIDRLVRDSHGRWVAHRFTDLPGLPVGYAFDAHGKLLLLVQDAIGDLCRSENGGWQILRIDALGETETLL